MSGLRTESGSRHCPVCGSRFESKLDGDDWHVPCGQCGHASWYRMQEFGNTVVINVLPSLDLERSDLTRVIEFLRRRGTETHVVVNMSLVQYIGSTFLDRLIISKRRLAAINGKLILCGFNEAIEEVFRVTRLDGFFEIVDEDVAVPKLPTAKK